MSTTAQFIRSLWKRCHIRSLGALLAFARRTRTWCPKTTATGAGSAVQTRCMSVCTWQVLWRKMVVSTAAHSTQMQGCRPPPCWSLCSLQVQKLNAIIGLMPRGQIGSQKCFLSWSVVTAVMCTMKQCCYDNLKQFRGLHLQKPQHPVTLLKTFLLGRSVCGCECVCVYVNHEPYMSVSTTSEFKDHSVIICCSENHCSFFIILSNFLSRWIQLVLVHDVCLHRGWSRCSCSAHGHRHTDSKAQVRPSSLLSCVLSK